MPIDNRAAPWSIAAVSAAPYIVTLPAPIDPAPLLAQIGPADRGFCMDAGSRYTFAGIAPVATFQSCGPFVTRWSGEERLSSCEDPLTALRRFAEILPTLPADSYLPFYGGLVGYVGFEWGAGPLSECQDTALAELPDAWFGLYDTVLVIDRVERSSWVASLGLDAGLQPRRDLARGRAEAFAETIMDAVDRVPTVTGFAAGPLMAEDLIPVSPRRRYREIARDVKRCLRQGTVQRLNLAPRYVGLLPEEPWEIHRRLRGQNPAPYAMYLNPGPFQLCSLSPTSFLTMEDHRLVAKPVLAHWPLAERRALGSPADSFAATPGARGLLHRLREELSPLAEQQRVRESAPGFEEDAQSIRLSCTLDATLRQELSLLDALAVIVPGLSMTGYPKAPAVQFLQAHEPCRRHAYTGAMGYWGPQQRAQLNLCVRLLTIRDGLGYVHAASWFDAQTDVEAALDHTDHGVASFFSQLHHLPITTIHEQSLY